MLQIAVSYFVINTRIIIIKTFTSVFKILHYHFDKGSSSSENATYVSNAKMYRLEDIMYHHV
jgi:hypothetical protein